MFDEDKFDEFRDELKFISNEINKEPQFQIIISEHPKLSKDDKKDMITSIFYGKCVKNQGFNILLQLIDNGMEKVF